MYGYHGEYLHVDLGRERAERCLLPDGLLRSFIGGTGLGVALLLRIGVIDRDPLAGESPLAFVFSPLVGSPLTTSAKFAVVAKSPLTGRYNDSLASSRFAITGKRAVGDALVLQGKAKRLSVLVIRDGAMELQSAVDLAGCSVPETERRLRRRFGAAADFAVVGPAGENQVRYATISHDGRHAGRGGHHVHRGHRPD